jgi:hypothetical protein
MKDARSYRDVPLARNGDPYEGQTEGKDFSALCGNTVLVSCWSMFEKGKEKDFFEIPEYAGRNDLAIVSTDDAVRSILGSDKLIEKNVVKKFESKKIDYYDYGKMELTPDNDRPGFCLDAVFRKPRIVEISDHNVNYERQREFRFGWMINYNIDLESLTLYVRPSEYVKSILINSNAGNVDDIRKAVRTGLIAWDVRFNECCRDDMIEIMLNGFRQGAVGNLR